MTMIKGPSKSTDIKDVDSVCDYINNVLHNKLKDKYSKPDGRIIILQ